MDQKTTAQSQDVGEELLIFLFLAVFSATSVGVGEQLDSCLLPVIYRVVKPPSP
jgi:hypothetical protein